MNIQNFNQLLWRISSTYKECEGLKQELAGYKSSQMIDCIEKGFGKGQGWIQRGTLLDWVNQERQGSKQTKKVMTIQELSEMFPFEKISLTVLITTCLSKAHPDQSTMKKQLEPDQSILEVKNSIISLIRSIVNLQLQIKQLRRQLIPMIELYVPMSGKNLTLEELKDYLLLGHQSGGKQFPIDPNYVMMALNGKKNSAILEFQMYKGEKVTIEKENQAKVCPAKNTSQTKDRITQIMNRLNIRVDNFGNQWLINRPEQMPNQ